MEDDLNNFGMEDKFKKIENGRRPKKSKQSKQNQIKNKKSK